jgi:hypothetical protein
MDCLSLAMRVRWIAAATLVCISSGCLLSPQIRGTGSESTPPVAPDPNRPEATPTPGATSPDPAQLSAAMAEVHKLGQTDPQVQQALLDDLRRTDPALWPQLVNAYRSSLAFRQQSGERLARLNQQNGYVNTNVAGSAAAPASVTPVGATGDLSSPGQYLQNAIYPTTSTPYEVQLAPTPSSSTPAMPQPIPSATDGAILTTTPSADSTASYPTTGYPEVRLGAVEEASLPVCAVPRANDSSAVGATPSDAWQSQLNATIRAMETKIAASSNSAPSAADQAMLRMLYLAAGRRDDAQQPLVGISSAEQEFWTKELAGLAGMFDHQDGRDAQQRAAEAARQLQQAAAKLAQSTPLTVGNLAFCTEVSSFGVYKPMPTQTFKPGQQLLLYAEVENFLSEATDKGYRTTLGSRWELLDSRGNRVAGEDFGATEEVCRNIRRDFFVRYFLKLPKPLAAGQYTLVLAIDDTAAKKSARGQISVSVAE